MAAVSYDEHRSNFLEHHGYYVFRVWNNEVMNNIQGVMERILDLVENKLG